MDPTDYLSILRALEELPFPVGRTLLIDFLRGNTDNESIIKNRLHKLPLYASLAYTEEEIGSLITMLLQKKFIAYTSVATNRFWKLLAVTPKGKEELRNPKLQQKTTSYHMAHSPITSDDRRLFEEYADLLAPFNDEQKKAIVCPKPIILCIAGAGSGKTTVLTKRIEFLIKEKLVDPHNILAITFTRKARQEMMKRLEGVGNVKIETFNSFCEKILQQHTQLLYGGPMSVMTYKDKILAIKGALASISMDMERAISIYFSTAQKRSKSSDQLGTIFMNDCFFILDYLKSINSRIEDFCQTLGETAQSRMLYGVCKYLDAYMKKNRLRDYMDQILDTLQLFRMHPELIPHYPYLFVDEYQDVNALQIQLIDLLNPPQLFCVGDPRQSIFGWRGSNVHYMLDFPSRYNGCEVINLTTNYRSSPAIVSFINAAIVQMNLPPLHAARDVQREIYLEQFDSENEEFLHAAKLIKESNLPMHDIFVLARTNRQLNELAAVLRGEGIPLLLRSDEMRSPVGDEGGVTLATVHAIKGMEARMVIVVGCSGMHFPAKGSEHPVLEMLQIPSYDKEEEERRLFYVALSRAQDILHVTYSGKSHTYFLTPDMLAQLRKPIKRTPVFEQLRTWRKQISDAHGVAPFVIMHDSTLMEIAQKMPYDKEALLEIKGMGPTKVQKYGEELLRIVNGF